jgi:hypothetical protein
MPYPAISGSNVVWECDDGNDHEICMTTVTEPSVPALPAIGRILLGLGLVGLGLRKKFIR